MVVKSIPKNNIELHVYVYFKQHLSFKICVKYATYPPNKP